MKMKKNISTHKFPYNWNLSGTTFKNDKGKVFSCFSCGGGSSMGYKLAGYDVIGCNEIDPKMMKAYITNLNPKYPFLEPIQTFKDRTDLPEELYNLDILDGSPPCSSFSMSGNRENDWGKEKVFTEGQTEQVLDTLFFDFIDLANKLQPKVVVAENVKGLMMGNAKKYVRKIYEEFDKAGYYVQHWLLDASSMGVPQRRERVFFIALRKDLADPFIVQKDMFTFVPKLELIFNESEIPFKEIDDINVTETKVKLYPSYLKCWKDCKIGNNFSTVHHKKMLHNANKVDPNKVLPTIPAHKDGGSYHWKYPRHLTDKENCLAGSFPLDYDFLQLRSKYLIGMSVPPIMVAQISTEIHNQWLSKINL